jgi:hypothetical protein
MLLASDWLESSAAATASEETWAESVDLPVNLIA